MVRKSRKQLTVRFLHRATLFLSFFSLGLILLFFFGNAQNFLDSSQFVVLGSLSVSSVLSTVVSCVSLVLELFGYFRHRRGPYLAMASVSFICAVFSFATALSARGVLLVAAGTGR